MDVLAVYCFNAGWLAGVIQSQGVSDTARCRAISVFAGSATCSSRVMATVATSRLGTKRLGGLPSRQPCWAASVAHLGRPIARAPQKRAREDDNDDEDVKLSEARDSLNWWSAGQLVLLVVPTGNCQGRHYCDIAPAGICAFPEHE